MHVTREEIYVVWKMDLRCGVLKRPQRNVSESAKYEKENKERHDGMVDVYLARYIDYVNVIIPQILKGELSQRDFASRRDATEMDVHHKNGF